jgi:hypothetical protein
VAPPRDPGGTGPLPYPATQRDYADWVAGWGSAALWPRYFKCGQLTRLCLDYIRAHAGEPITVADIMPLAIGDRVLNAREQEILRVTIHQALHKIAKRGAIERMASQGRIVR